MSRKTKGKLNGAKQVAVNEAAVRQAQAQQNAVGLEIRLRVAGYAAQLLAGDVGLHTDGRVQDAVATAIKLLDETDAAFARRALQVQNPKNLEAEVEALKARLSNVSLELARRAPTEPAKPPEVAPPGLMPPEVAPLDPPGVVSGDGRTSAFPPDPEDLPAERDDRDLDF